MINMFTDSSTGNKYTLQELIAYIRTTYSLKDRNSLYIGVDSQQNGKSLLIATVVVIHKNNNGGRFFFNRERVPKVNTLRQRLLFETQRATEVALELHELEDLCEKFVVHLDINIKEQFKSNQIIAEAKSYVLGQGFECEVKPNAWASSCVADRLTKSRSKRSKQRALYERN